MRKPAFFSFSNAELCTAFSSVEQCCLRSQCPDAFAAVFKQLSLHLEAASQVEHCYTLTSCCEQCKATTTPSTAGSSMFSAPETQYVLILSEEYENHELSMKQMRRI